MACIVESNAQTPFFRARWIRGWRSRQETAFSAPGSLLMTIFSHTILYTVVSVLSTLNLWDSCRKSDTDKDIRTHHPVNVGGNRVGINGDMYSARFSLHFSFSRHASASLAVSFPVYCTLGRAAGCGHRFACGRGYPAGKFQKPTCRIGSTGKCLRLRWPTTKRRYCRIVTSSWHIVHVWVCNESSPELRFYSCPVQTVTSWSSTVYWCPLCH